MNPDNSTYTFSELVYLFANETVQASGVLGLKEEHPSGKKLKTQDLAQQMLLSAYAYLVSNGYLEFELRKGRRLLIFKTNNLYVKLITKGKGGITGIEQEIISTLKSEITIKSATYNLLKSDSFDPWGDIVKLTRDSLIRKRAIDVETQKKFVFTTYTYKFAQGFPENFRSEYKTMMKPLSDFEKTIYFDQLCKEIAEGIKLRQEKSDTSDD